jgi:hypothetical protein
MSSVKEEGVFTTIHRDDGKIVIASDMVYDHIGTHQAPGKGSVFSGNITRDMINEKISSESIPDSGGGIPVDFGVDNGFLLVAPIEVAMQLKDATIKPGSKEDFNPDTKQMEPVEVAEVHTSQPITDFTADVATLLVFPYDPGRSTEDQNSFVDSNPELSQAKSEGRLYALATAFPGGFSLTSVAGIPVPEDKQNGVPKATEWGGVDNPSWAVIIPSMLTESSRWQELAGL